MTREPPGVHCCDESVPCVDVSPAGYGPGSLRDVPSFATTSRRIHATTPGYVSFAKVLAIKVGIATDPLGDATQSPQVHSSVRNRSRRRRSSLRRKKATIRRLRWATIDVHAGVSARFRFFKVYLPSQLECSDRPSKGVVSPSHHRCFAAALPAPRCDKNMIQIDAEFLPQVQRAPTVPLLPLSLVATPSGLLPARLQLLESLV